MALSTTGSVPSSRTRPTTDDGSTARSTEGSRSRSPSATPATSAAIGPMVSNDGASGHTPSSGMRPKVVLRPTVPQHAEGVRTEPAVSVPMATSASPVATATAHPLDEPPGMRDAVEWVHGRPVPVVDAGAAERQLVQVGLAHQPGSCGPDRCEAGRVDRGWLGPIGHCRAAHGRLDAGDVDGVLHCYTGAVAAGVVQPPNPSRHGPGQ